MGPENLARQIMGLTVKPAKTNQKKGPINIEPLIF
jgi:hypothetical protein